jgi:integrase
MIIKSFYSYIGLKLTKADTTYRKSRERKYKDVALSESDFKALVDAGDYKEKLRTVWLAQTGMRVGDAQRFKVSDLTEYDLENLKAKKTPMCIEYVPEKTMGREIGERYTFLGAFGIRLLSADLKYRIEKDGIEAVRNQYVFQGQGGDNTALSTVQWTSMHKELAKRAQLELNGKHGRIRSHCFRKFFDSVLQGKNVNRNVVYWMMGHKLE